MYQATLYVNDLAYSHNNSMRFPPPFPDAETKDHSDLICSRSLMSKLTFEPKPMQLQNLFNHSTELRPSKVGIYGKASKIERQKNQIRFFLFSSLLALPLPKKKIISSHVKLQKAWILVRIVQNNAWQTVGT